MERKAKDILGLPVVTFDRGNKIYDIEDLIIDPERKQVLALVVSERALFHSARAIPFGRVTAIGPDAVIVPNGKAVLEVDRDIVLKRLYNDQSVRGLRVITDDGRKLGQVDDMLIDDHTGEIKGYFVSIGRVLNVTQGARWLPADQVLNMGMRVLYVSGAVADDFEKQLGGWAGALDQAGGKLKDAGSRANDSLVDAGTRARSAVNQLDLPGKTGNIAVGRTAHSTVTDGEGTIIVRDGETITQDHVDAARNANRLPQLLMSAGRATASTRADSAGDQLSQSFEDIKAEARQLWERLTGNYSTAVDRADDRVTTQRIRHALGRPVTRVILDENDNIILNTGDIITNRAVEAARQAGVLDQLVSSVYTEKPKLGLDDLKAPRTGEASLDMLQTGSSGASTVASVTPAVPSAVEPAASTSPAKHATTARPRHERADTTEQI